MVQATLQPNALFALAFGCWQATTSAEHVGFGQCGTPSALQADWPRFDSAAELASSAWYAYLKGVYPGFTTSDLSYPFCPGTHFWMIYDKGLKAAGIQEIVPATKNSMPGVGAFCPDQDNLVPGYVYEENSVYQPRDTFWVWQTKTMPSFAANTWVEVIHQADPYGDETQGAWLLYGAGSGIWFNVGKTIVFKEHEDAYKHFAAGNTAMSVAAAKQGYDSIQFTAHVDKVNYPCAKTFKYIMNTEIVAVKFAGTTACVSNTAFRAGWKASRACTCVNSVGFLNCKEVNLPARSNATIIV